MTSVLGRTLIAPIRFYQRFISPALPPSCRFTPSCSAYAVGAISEHGAFRGLWLAVKRLGKCHPWHRGGYDPVPPRRNAVDPGSAVGRKSELSDVSQTDSVVEGQPDSGSAGPVTSGSGSLGSDQVPMNSTTNSLGLVASTQSIGRGTA